MFKTDIEFSKNTLYIDIEGVINKRNLRKLRKKLYYIANEYDVGEIVINTRKGTNIDEEALYNFLDEYDDLYGDNLTIIDD